MFLENTTIIHSYSELARSGVAVTCPVRTAVRFETGSERYGELNCVQAIGIGEISFDTGRIRYDIYALQALRNCRGARSLYRAIICKDYNSILLRKRLRRAGTAASGRPWISALARGAM